MPIPPPAVGVPYVLGIDLGTNSVGWTLVELKNGAPAGVLRTGVRVFDAGMEGNIETGNEASRNQHRREARLHRRQVARRARRMAKLFRLLQGNSLLPPSPNASPTARQLALTELDNTILASKWFAAHSHRATEPMQVMPYLLRARALDGPLEPNFLGRALYHLAQRRGFRSNRKEAPSRKKEEGEVKQAIGELSRKMEECGARTLGEFLSRLPPSEERIRARWTAREMYEREFEAIWSAQLSHHAGILTAKLKNQIYKTIFFQRPLKLQRNLIGRCELEPDQRRAPKYLPIAQRFRLLQTVNNLRICLPGAVERELASDERAKLVETLERDGDMKCTAARKLLAFPKKDVRLSIESAGETILHGNRTNAKLLKVFGERWGALSDAERNQAIQDVNSIQSEDARKQCALHRWALDQAAAERFAKIAFEPDYFSISRKAMEKLLPLLEQGISYAKARKQLYPEKFEARAPLSLLPPVQQALPAIRNPAVMRSLTELRKVVNAVARTHGRPAEIRIELARDLKKPKWLRQDISKRNSENAQERARAKARIKEASGDGYPSPRDVRKVLLFDECRGNCVYCGDSIPWDNFFGKESAFDIDHIIPFSRSLDDSFVNVVLCHAACNRDKGNRTPSEWLSGDPQNYERFLERVRNFSGRDSVKKSKCRRFTLAGEDLEKFLSEWKNRQLNDTAYASGLAARYLALLYGGRVDAEGKLRIRISTGQLTKYLRDGWQLNGLLDDGPTKNGGYRPKTRDDHRHHAVDALVIALTDDGTIQQLSLAAERAPAERRRMFASLEGPWPDFVPSVRAALGQIVVSHRVSRKVSGPLHEETYYSNRQDGAKTTRVRKLLSGMTKGQLEKIADPAVRRIVLQKLGEAGTDDPKKAFSTDANLPFFRAASGKRVPIKRARIELSIPVEKLGDGKSGRFVTSEMNHHVEIYAESDDQGRETAWDGEVVSMLEAYRRKQRGEPIVKRNHGPLVLFKFSLAAGDVLECNDMKGGRRLLVVRSISEDSRGGIQVGVVSLTDARLKKEIVASKGFTRPAPNALRKWNARKVSIGPLGEISEAHD